jgi:hypothetical protein
MAKNHNTGKEKVLMCNKCDFTAPHNILLKRHVLKKHDIDKHKKCPCCDFKTPQPYKLYIHIDNQHPEYEDKKLSCEKCGKSFIYEPSLKYHVIYTCKFRVRKQKKSKHMCELCGIEYQTSVSLQIHMAKHHNTGEEPVLICDKCDFTALHKTILQSHFLTKHAIDKHKKCPCCEYKTPHTQKLYIHIDSQHPEYGDKKLSCEKCGKSFIYELSLKQHVKFQCKFSDYLKLKPKKKQKSKKMSNVKCDYCCEILNGANHIKTHYKELHPDKPIILDGIDKFHCEYCEVFFFSKHNLERHSHKKHGKEPDAGKRFCKKCSKPFSIQHKCQKENGKEIVILVITAK